MAVIVKDTNGLLNLHTKTTPQTSSSLIELQAAILGLEKMQHHTHLRIRTDSRYVIKGLTEWVINWKLNNWRTAQGRPVKNIAFWKRFDELAQGKYIEFKWVKGHSEQLENSRCDFYARSAALRMEL